MKIVAYTDGSCLTNPGFAGWGVYMRRRNKKTGKMQQRSLAGAHPCATNNMMELQAAIEAVKRTPRTCSLVVITDSQYVQKGASEWSVGWIKRGWKKSDGSPVVNKDQWIELMSLIKGRDVTFKWVRGHDGNRGNEYADQLCGDAARALRDNDKKALSKLYPHGVACLSPTPQQDNIKRRRLSSIPKSKLRFREIDEEFERARDQFYENL